MRTKPLETRAAHDRQDGEKGGHARTGKADGPEQFRGIDVSKSASGEFLHV
ncbi:MAG: hypothetical protein R3C97_08525 [Geminicoccaceae bacterium]